VGKNNRVLKKTLSKGVGNASFITTRILRQGGSHWGPNCLVGKQRGVAAFSYTLQKNQSEHHEATRRKSVYYSSEKSIRGEVSACQVGTGTEVLHHRNGEWKNFLVPPKRRETCYARKGSRVRHLTGYDWGKPSGLLA